MFESIGARIVAFDYEVLEWWANHLTLLGVLEFGLVILLIVAVAILVYGCVLVNNIRKEHGVK